MAKPKRNEEEKIALDEILKADAGSNLPENASPENESMDKPEPVKEESSVEGQAQVAENQHPVGQSKDDESKDKEDKTEDKKPDAENQDLLNAQTATDTPKVSVAAAELFYEQAAENPFEEKTDEVALSKTETPDERNSQTESPFVLPAEANEDVKTGEQSDSQHSPNTQLYGTKAHENQATEDEKPEYRDVANDPNQLKADIEAVLLITAKPLKLNEIAELVEASAEDVEMAIGELIQDFAFREGSGLEIDDTDGYILQVREDCARIVHKMMPLELSPAIIRTLSAIAIKAPILQSDLIELRGSTAYDHIAELLSKKMISKRRQGRSYVLNTTRAFDDYFKLSGDKKELETLVNRLKPEHKTASGDVVSEELKEIPPLDFEKEHFENESGTDLQHGLTA